MSTTFEPLVIKKCINNGSVFSCRVNIDILLETSIDNKMYELVRFAAVNKIIHINYRIKSTAKGKTIILYRFVDVIGSNDNKQFKIKEFNISELDLLNTEFINIRIFESSYTMFMSINETSTYMITENVNDDSRFITYVNSTNEMITERKYILSRWDHAYQIVKGL